MATVKYVVKAELINNDMAVESAETLLELFRKPENSKFPLQSWASEEKIGGYFGYNQTTSHNSITLDKADVAPGDMLKVRFKTDNSMCKHRL